MSPTRFALSQLKRGETLVYYRGFLLRDRKKLFPITGFAPLLISNPEVMEHGDAAMEYYHAGKVVLFQRKLGINDYEYLARRV